MSKMTSRAKPITRGVVARTSTVNAAVRSPYTRRQNTNIMTTQGRGAQRGGQAGGGLAAPEGAEREGDRAEVEGRLVEVGDRVEGRHHPRAGLGHLPRDLGVSPLVRIDERQVAEPGEEQHRRQEEGHPGQRPGLPRPHPHPRLRSVGKLRERSGGSPRACPIVWANGRAGSEAFGSGLDSVPGALWAGSARCYGGPMRRIGVRLFAMLLLALAVTPAWAHGLRQASLRIESCRQPRRDRRRGFTGRSRSRAGRRGAPRAQPGPGSGRSVRPRPGGGHRDPDRHAGSRRLRASPGGATGAWRSPPSLPPWCSGSSSRRPRTWCTMPWTPTRAPAVKPSRLPSAARRRSARIDTTPASASVRLIDPRSIAPAPTLAAPTPCGRAPPA